VLREAELERASVEKEKIQAMNKKLKEQLKEGHDAGSWQ
jgi:hypothetical protein